MWKKWLVSLTCVATFGTSHAAVVALVSSPMTWRLENYAGDSVALWFTGSPCTNGQVMFSAAFTKTDMNRFWVTVTAAKLSGAKMFVNYDNSNVPASCPIVSFGLDPS